MLKQQLHSEKEPVCEEVKIQQKEVEGLKDTRLEREGGEGRGLGRGEGVMVERRVLEGGYSCNICFD